jgi:hypothetical protein
MVATWCKTGPPEKLPRTEAVQQGPAQVQDDFAVSLSSNRRASVRTCAAWSACYMANGKCDLIYVLGAIPW